MKRITLALAAFVTLALPANAQNFNSWQHWNLNTMTDDEQARIQSGLRNGSLTSQEASRLQNRLNRINQLKAQMTVGGLSMSEKVQLDNELDKLAEAIYRESRDTERNSRWLGNNPWDWARGNRNNNNNYLNLPSWKHWNLNTMTDDEQARINAGLRNGTLTRDEANRLQARLNEIKTLKTRLSTGGLSLSEQQKIDRDLDRLAEKIYKETNDGERSRWLGSSPWDWTRGNNRPVSNVDMPSWQHWNFNTMTDDEQARITAGLKNGSLTAEEGTRLQNRLNEINNLKTRLSAGGLSWKEKQEIDRHLDAFGQELYKESNDNERGRWLGTKPWDWTQNNNNRNDWKRGDRDGDGDVDKRDWKRGGQGWNNNTSGANIDARQTQQQNALQSSQYDNKEKKNLGNEYDRIQKQEAKMRETGGSLNWKEQKRLDRKMDKLDKKMNRDKND